MSFKHILKSTEKFVVDNSPSILTGIGVVGAVTTAVLAGTASYKAGVILENERWIVEKKPEVPPLDRREELALVWHLYIPAAFVGTITVISIVGANRVGSKRAAALAAAYSLSEKAFTEYRYKIVETLGKNKEQQARDELAQERFDRTPTPSAEVLMIASGKVLCYDAYTGRYFESDMETLKKAQNDTNYQIINNWSASLSDFYERIGLSTTPMSDEVGWNSEKLLEVEFSTVLSEDGRPCISINFNVVPVRNYWKVG